MKNWKKYYEDRPVIEIYKGWKIRKHEYQGKYYQKTFFDYICDVRPGVESIRCANLQRIKEWIDQKIKEGKIQREDTDKI